MKTPREIILGKHRELEVKLKAISAEKLAACAREALVTKKIERRNSFSVAAIRSRFWAEAVLPWRRAWMTMAAAWVCILLVSVFTSDRSGGGARQAGVAKPDPQTRMILLEQQQMLAQLLGPMSEPRVSHSAAGGPRSDLRLEQVVV